MDMFKKAKKPAFNLRGVNKIIKILTFSDVLLMGSFGFVAPIFAVFITGTLKDGNLEVVGIASTIYLLTKSISQLPAANLIDRIRGERDDFWVMFISSIGISLVPLLYLLISNSGQLYVVQFVYGVAAAFSFPSWMAMFTRHIDKDLEGREWGIYYTLTDLVSAGTAAIGGVIAYRFGFAPLFIMVSLFGLTGAFFLFGIYKFINKKGFIEKIIKK